MQQSARRDARFERIHWVFVGGALLAAAATVAVILAVAQPTVVSRPTPTASATFPPEAASLRPLLHITPAEHWMNDPQRPFFADGRWHAYYLYNADYPEGNGTAWYHITSTDLVTWRDEGVAIEKYQNGLGDIQSGSAVIDTENTAGFGAGAVIALVTQQSEGVQRQSLFVSTDDGYTFTPYEGNPVIENPGVEDFRDPKVVWDGTQWVMALAEGDKIGFYTSPDLKTWSYTSGFTRDDLGLLECPDLFEMSIGGDPERTVWVLGASADGAQFGRGAGYAYWSGAWDGSSFTPTTAEPQWLDHGADFYAAVTWSDTIASREQQLSTRYAMGWVNNWAYARELPDTGWQGGAQSLVRELSLVEVDGRPTLRGAPVAALGEHVEPVSEAGAELAADAAVSVVPADTGASRITFEVHRDQRADRIDLVVGDAFTATVSVDLAAGQVRVDRSADAVAPTLGDTYRAVQTAPFTWVDDTVAVEVVVDGLTLEVFVNGGEASLTSLVFVDAPIVSVTSIGGDAKLDGVTVERLVG